MSTFYVLLATLCTLSGQSANKVTELAPGVYAIEHASGGGPESGNTTVIIGDRQVLVVDAAFLPRTTREDVAQIHQWTDKPVTFLLNTHFHNDHNFGNRIYMDAFPALTIIAHTETKREMDMYGPSSARRQEAGEASLQRMLTTNKSPDGKPLSKEDQAEVKTLLTVQKSAVEDMKTVTFQSATMTFDHDFAIDLGNREVEIKFLGRGNTGGDAVAYLPKERIVVAGDLVAAPIPNTYDGYPTEWIETLQNLGAIDASTIVPGHGSIMHDKTYVFLVRDLLKSAVDQMNAKLRQTGPAMFQTLDGVKGAVDLTPFRQRFLAADSTAGPAFDDMATNLVKVVFEEATLR